MNLPVPKSVFNLMADHIGHDVHLTGYGKGAKPPWVGIAIECNDCDAIIADWEIQSDRKVQKTDNTKHLRKLLRRCLDFWALEDTDMPHPDLFDEVVRASGWRGSKEKK